jgi:sugar/nucleoside kinase (ribokinase family)
LNLARGKGAIDATKDDIWEFDASKSAISTGQIIDAIGAGDNFDARFVRGWLLDWEIKAALSWPSMRGLQSGACWRQPGSSDHAGSS